jgi:hypothetical protein
MISCKEFQNELAEVMGEHWTPAQQTHLKSCAQCSGLVADLEKIASTASSLSAVDEPHPRVWLKIEASLKAEGLIRESAAAEAHRSRLLDILAPFRWRPVLVPVAAALILAAGFFLYNRQGVRPSSDVAVKQQPAQPAVNATTQSSWADADDQQLLAEIAQRFPTLRNTYEDNLRHVNAYIQDAQRSVDENPNDEEAHLYLMDAYEQKAMVYEMAMDRSLP